MTRITALLFDWGGVLQRTVSDAPRRALERELGLPEGTIESAVFGHSAWQEASLGRLSGDAAWRHIGGDLGLPEGTLDRFVARFFAGDRVDAALVRLVRALRGRGVRVGLLSNAPPARSAPLNAAARWGMEGLFDVQVFSHQIAALKPSPRAFEAALEALGTAPGETLFVDDLPENIAGAAACGLATHHYRGREGLLAALRAAGLPVEED